VTPLGSCFSRLVYVSADFIQFFALSSRRLKVGRRLSQGPRRRPGQALREASSDKFKASSPPSWGSSQPWWSPGEIEIAGFILLSTTSFFSGCRGRTCSKLRTSALVSHPITRWVVPISLPRKSPWSSAYFSLHLLRYKLLTLTVAVDLLISCKVTTFCPGVELDVVLDSAV
jgi:hypothetical protein